MSRPSNFFFNVNGDEAERLLRQYGEDGDFLARRSESQPNGYTLSILRAGSVTHVKVNTHCNGYVDLYGGETFSSLPELVQHYIENPAQLELKSGGTITMRRALSIPLEEPAGAEARIPTAQKWFHNNITGDEARHLLENEKPWTFIVRESLRTPGSYAITVKTDLEIVHILIKKNPETDLYTVDGGDEFTSIAELLQHYRDNPMVEDKSQRVVYLQRTVPSTCLPADAIDERIRILSEIDQQSKRDGFYDEFDIIQQADDQFFSKREGKKDINVTKNRYKNIVPYDHTRVIITDQADPVDRYDTDYINANYIKVPDGIPSRKVYISTQGCLENTVVDFWRMMWQVNSRVIVMTAKVQERGKNKCFQYWPDIGREKTYRGYYVKTVSEEATRDRDGYEIFVRRRFMVSRKGAPLREIFQLQYVGWPDHGCPDRAENVLMFLETADETYTAAPAMQGPMVVHCSAGIGRTGTFIVIDILRSLIRSHGPASPIDVQRMVRSIREQRSGMVQTEDQYAFLYRAVSAFVRQIHRRSLDFGDLPLYLPPPPLPVRHKSGSTETE